LAERILVSRKHLEKTRRMVRKSKSPIMEVFAKKAVKDAETELAWWVAPRGGRLVNSHAIIFNFKVVVVVTPWLN